MSGALSGAAASTEKIPLFVKCAGCGERIKDAQLVAAPARLELDPIFVLCEPCYVHIRRGYQRDRDQRKWTFFGYPPHLVIKDYQHG